MIESCTSGNSPHLMILPCGSWIESIQLSSSWSERTFNHVHSMYGSSVRMADPTDIHYLGIRIPFLCIRQCLVPKPLLRPRFRVSSSFCSRSVALMVYDHAFVSKHIRPATFMQRNYNGLSQRGFEVFYGLFLHHRRTLPIRLSAFLDHLF